MILFYFVYHFFLLFFIIIFFWILFHWFFYDFFVYSVSWYNMVDSVLVLMFLCCFEIFSNFYFWFVFIPSNGFQWKTQQLSNFVFDRMFIRQLVQSHIEILLFRSLFIWNSVLFFSFCVFKFKSNNIHRDKNNRSETKKWFVCKNSRENKMIFFLV